MKQIADIEAGRLDPARLAANFADAHPPLRADEAAVDASRCYFCHDAPCTEACPTGIDVPGFIRGIATGNLRGAAETILSANIMGGSCARVCPTEILCEQACVRTAQEQKPVAIGALQRHATDWLMERGIQPFTRAPATGRRVAVVGAGPAGLACAHRLAVLGHDVTVFEAKPKPGGLNEYGIAAYKLADDFAAREVAFILAVGGISIEYDRPLGGSVTLDALRRDFDAVFLGIGLGGVNALRLGETPHGVSAAVDFIAALRQAPDKATLPVGRRVVVIGGGNTAIDAATQARRLGAEQVTIAYRRGPAEMSATPDEQDWAQTNGVAIRHHLTPHAFHATEGALTAVAFTRTGAKPDTPPVVIEADMALLAVGQALLPTVLGDAGVAVEGGRIRVDPATLETSLPGVYAGGDCISGIDLTVQAVQDGKRAARAIDARLKGAHHG